MISTHNRSAPKGAKSGQAVRTFPLVGAHLSIAGGHYRAIERGGALGCTAVQLFTKNQVQWSAKPLAVEDVERFRGAFRASSASAGGVRLLCGHGSYLYNFASPSRALREASIRGLVDELERCDLLGIPLLVVHPGSHRGSGEKKGLATVVKTMAKALSRYRGGTTVCIETTAGQGAGLGYRFSHLGEIIRTLGDGRVGACLDTCHVFAAGYDIRTRAGFRSTMEMFDEEAGIEHLRVIHLNDSKGALASRIDRHAHIGKGEIGRNAFGFFMRDVRFRGIPKIIETPKREGKREMDGINLEVLRALGGRAGGAA